MDMSFRKKLGEQYHVIEEGCSGRTTVYDSPGEPWKNGLSYLKPCLHTHKPLDIVILMLGTNDLKRCFHASSSEIAENIGSNNEKVIILCFINMFPGIHYK